MGDFYRTGEHLERNIEQALLWLHRAAEQNDARAMHALGEMYQTGDGVEQDEGKAAEWFRREEEEGEGEGISISFDLSGGDDKEMEVVYVSESEDGTVVSTLPPVSLDTLVDAVVSGDAEAVKRLLDAGAKLDDKDENGWTALMYATNWSPEVAVEVIKVLLAAGADVKLKDKKGKTALGYAKEKGDPQVIELLRAAGAKE